MPGAATRPVPTWLRYAALASLYVAQGLPFGFFSHAVPVLLNRTHPPELVGLSSLLAVPWGLKFLFGPTVDRLPNRKRAIIPLNLLAVGSLVALGLARPAPGHLTPMLAGFFIVSVFSALQDVATDALALDVLTVEERGRGGAVQVAAQRAGIIAGGGGLLAILDTVGYRDAFFVMAAAIGLLTLPVLAIREAPRPAPTPARASVSGRLFGTFFERADAWMLVIALVGFKLGDALAAGMVHRWFVKQGLDNAAIGITRGVVGGVAAIGGASVGGALYRALGARRALVLTAALQTAAIAMYAVLDRVRPVGSDAAPLPMPVFYGASVAEHALGGAATAALFARMMDLSRPDARATDFTVMACVLASVTGLGIVASGFVTGALGLFGLFVVAAAVGLVAPLAARRLGRMGRMARMEEIAG